MKNSKKKYRIIQDEQGNYLAQVREWGLFWWEWNHIRWIYKTPEEAEEAIRLYRDKKVIKYI